MERRLLILTPSSGWGGAEEYMVAVAGGAREAGWRVTLAFQANAEADVQRRVHPGMASVRFIDAPLAKQPTVGGVMGQMSAAARVLARVRPTMALIVLPWPDMGLGLMLATAGARIPTAVVFQLAPWRLALSSRAPAYRWSRRHGARWIAVSRQNRDAIAGTFGVAPDGIQVIHNGVGERQPVDAAARRAAHRRLRSELALSSNARVLLSVGRLDAQKGHSDLLSVAPSIIERTPDTVFVWAGDGPLRAELESEIRRNRLEQKVRILGYRRDVPALLLGSDLFLFPSRFEGHPFALLEAMAAGIPVVTSDAGGAPEIVRTGIDGIVHRQGDVAELGSCLAWALDHPDSMAQMAVSGRARVEMFSEEAMLRKTLAVLDALSA